jgi:hypothetical protein
MLVDAPKTRRTNVDWIDFGLFQISNRAVMQSFQRKLAYTAVIKILSVEESIPHS